MHSVKSTTRINETLFKMLITLLWSFFNFLWDLVLISVSLRRVSGNSVSKHFFLPNKVVYCGFVFICETLVQVQTNS